MSENLQLTEPFAADCIQAACPWLKDGCCQLTGKLLNIMAADRPVSTRASQDDNPVSAVWLKKKQNQLDKLSTSCIFPGKVREQLAQGILPLTIQLVTNNEGQMQNLLLWANSKRMSGINIQQTNEPQGLEISYANQSR